MTSIPQDPTHPTIILVPGYWLGAWAWEDVLQHLTAAGLDAVAMTLPGLDYQDPERVTRTINDQAAAIQSAIDSVKGDVVLVGHSGANGPVSLLLDRSPERVRRVVWVDSGPMAPGGSFAPDLPEAVTELPLPDFDVLCQQASLDGLSNEHLDRFRSKAVPEPGPVARARVQLTSAARLNVPTTLVCCSLSSAQVLELAEAGNPMFTEVSQLKHVDLTDLPTGHWPMWSRPEALAEVIHDVARQTR